MEQHIFPLLGTRPMDDIVAELKTRGVTFKGNILNYPAVRIATLLDPDNNEILLSQVLAAGEEVQSRAS